jgi:uncharacterized membrane protein YbhN (UPF0104 family)
MNWKTLLKLVLSVVIIWLVLRSIDERLLLATLQQANFWWLLWAAAWFVLSKIIGALRFNILLATETIHLSNQKNLRLYWLGMYYNLLLPGGVSGDGYKIKLLMDAFGAPFKRLFAVTLLDRVGGVIALGQLSLVLAFGIPVLRQFWWLGVIALVVSIPVSKLIYKKLGVNPTPDPSPPAGGEGSGVGLSVWAKTSLLSLAVQLAQLVATFGIVLALGESAKWLEYSILFLVSSVVAMLPLTIGGTGARELTFLWGADFFQIHSEKAVAIAFLFYLISTAVAFVGVVFSFNEKVMKE